MKRVVLRVKDGVVCVSAPPRVSKRDIDKFVQSKTDWIQEQLAKPSKSKPELKHYDDAACLEKFKDYKSRWGVCYHNRGYIILSKQLFDKPIPAIEYVILHEYAHFLVQDHGVNFHRIMSELMPDYRQRRKLLRISKEGF